jgi:hypothetical protein
VSAITQQVDGRINSDPSSSIMLMNLSSWARNLIPTLRLCLEVGGSEIHHEHFDFQGSVMVPQHQQYQAVPLQRADS